MKITDPISNNRNTHTHTHSVACRFCVTVSHLTNNLISWKKKKKNQRGRISFRGELLLLTLCEASLWLQFGHQLSDKRGSVRLSELTSAATIVQNMRSLT